MDFVRNCNGKGFHEHPANPPIFDVMTSQYTIVAVASWPIIDYAKSV